MKKFPRYRVSASYKTHYHQPISFEAGEVLEVKQRDTEYPEYIWAINQSGKEGWVHDSMLLKTSEHKAVSTKAYDARELDVEAGEVIVEETNLGGWSWCRNKHGQTGWLPDHVLERVTEVLPFSIRLIEAKDDAAIANIIRQVMPEFGATGDGFAINDPEVDWMTRAYTGNRSAYYVVTVDGEVKGGGGIAPLIGGDADTCELRKMYFLPEMRGVGAGAMLMAKCLQAARFYGFKKCYLETLDGMTDAQVLYQRSGFVKQSGAIGNTGHGGCNTFYILDL
jgi:putative acetyltransferase